MYHHKPISSDGMRLDMKDFVETEVGTPSNLTLDTNGRLKVNAGRLNVFGEQIITNYDPKIQSLVQNNLINEQLFVQFTATGGTITSTDNTNIDFSITNALGSFAVLRSKRSLEYKPGFNNICRMNVLFDTTGIGLNNSLQFAGVGSATDDLYICIQNGVFGVRRSTGGALHVEEFTITAAAGGVETATVTLNSVAYNINLTNAGGDLSFTAHELNTGNPYGGLWSTQHIDDKTYFIASAVGARNGTYSFSSTGSATATNVTQLSGVALTTEFVAQSDFNGGYSVELDLTKRQMFEIQYSFYGSGDIEFNILNPDTESYENMHLMKFSNLSADLSLTNPVMYLQRGIASLGSTTAMTMKAGGSYGAIVGTIKAVIEPRYGFDVEKTISAATETVIAAISNRLSVNGYQNTTEIILSYLSIAADGNRAVKIKLIKNPTTLFTP